MERTAFDKYCLSLSLVSWRQWPRFQQFQWKQEKLLYLSIKLNKNLVLFFQQKELLFKIELKEYSLHPKL